MSEEQPQRERTVVKCSLCGHEMAIPAGYEHAKAYCRVCGVELQTDAPAPEPEKKDEVPAPVVVSGLDEVIEKLPRTIVRGLVSGGIGFVVGGVLVGAHVLVGGGVSTGQYSLIGSFVLSADIGALVGFVLCCTWTMIKDLSVGPIGGMIIGICVALPAGITSYLLEWALISQPDAPIWQSTLVAVFGGWAVGLILSSVAPSFS